MTVPSTPKSFDSRDMEGAPAKVFDLEASLVRLGGSREILEKLVNLYFEDSARLLRELCEAEAAGDLEHFGRAAHTLKGLAANFDAAHATAAALRAEGFARGGDLESARGCLPEVQREFDRLRQALVTLNVPSR